MSFGKTSETNVTDEGRGDTAVKTESVRGRQFFNLQDLKKLVEKHADFKSMLEEQRDSKAALVEKVDLKT